MVGPFFFFEKCVVDATPKTRIDVPPLTCRKLSCSVATPQRELNVKDVLAWPQHCEGFSPKLPCVPHLHRCFLRCVSQLAEYSGFRVPKGGDGSRIQLRHLLLTAEGPLVRFRDSCMQHYDDHVSCTHKVRRLGPNNSQKSQILKVKAMPLMFASPSASLAFCCVLVAWVLVQFVLLRQCSLMS